MEFIEKPYSYAKCEKFLIKAGLCESPLIYAVEDEAKMFIGYVIFHEYDSKSFEIGWILRKEFWSKGYATQLTNLLLEKVKDMGKSAIIECDSKQAVTKIIALKCGFVFKEKIDGLDIYIKSFDNSEIRN